jgi:hypothetical protein
MDVARQCKPAMAPPFMPEVARLYEALVAHITLRPARPLSGLRAPASCTLIAIGTAPTGTRTGTVTGTGSAAIGMWSMAGTSLSSSTRPKGRES